MTRVITYGTYDLLHQGHVNLLRRAKELGDYLIVGVTSDSFDRGRGKLNVRNNVLERVEAVRRTGYADDIIIEDYLGQKIDDIQKYDVDKVGIVGSGRIANRFVPESKVVNGIDVTSVYDPNVPNAREFAMKHDVGAYSADFAEFLSTVDAIYIASPHLTHYTYAKAALEAGKHVLCEIPFTLSATEAKELYDYANAHNLVLLEASKTAYCPAFCHITTLVKSGIIGDVIDVKASLSKMVQAPTRELDARQAGGAMNEHAPLPLMSIVKILGTEYKDISFYSKVENEVDVYTRANIIYPHATASVTLGIGVKTEGNMVISGTKGYIYVPAPWWLTSFFEVRYEDQTKNKKYFYSYDGDGLRYEIQEFISMIVNNRRSCYKLRRRESIAIAGIIEKFSH